MYLPMVIAAEMTGRLCKKNNQLSFLLRIFTKEHRVRSSGFSDLGQ